MSPRHAWPSISVVAGLFALLSHSAAYPSPPPVRICVVVNAGPADALMFRSTTLGASPERIPKGVVPAKKLKSTIEDLLRKDGRFKPEASPEAAEVVFYVEAETTTGAVTVEPSAKTTGTRVQVVDALFLDTKPAPTTRLMAIAVTADTFRAAPRDATTWLPIALWQGVAAAEIGMLAPFETLVRVFVREYSGQPQSMVATVRAMVTPSSTERAPLPNSTLPSAIWGEGPDTSVRSSQDLADVRAEAERARAATAQPGRSREAPVIHEAGTLILRTHRSSVTSIRSAGIR